MKADTNLSGFHAPAISFPLSIMLCINETSGNPEQTMDSYKTQPTESIPFVGGFLAKYLRSFKPLPKRVTERGKRETGAQASYLIFAALWTKAPRGEVTLALPASLVPACHDSDWTLQSRTKEADRRSMADCLAGSCSSLFGWHPGRKRSDTGNLRKEDDAKSPSR